MKRVGLEKARTRLKHAFEAAEQLKAASDLEAVDAAWTRFLTAIAAVYEILKASCRGDSKSEGWFSNLQGSRKADNLLAYLMHARNVNDHGIDGVLELRRGSIGIGGGGGDVYIEKLEMVNGRITTLRGSQNGGPLQVRISPARAELIPVRSRDVDYQPPRSFMGKALADVSPLGVASVVLEFMATVFAEAEELAAQGAA